MKLIGLDPGLRATGWGVVVADGNYLRHIDNGAVRSDSTLPLSRRLRELHDGLAVIIDRYRPDVAVVEETFVNRNSGSTLKLGQARGAVLLTAALAGLAVHEYAANAIKKAVVGVGHADKKQVRTMVGILLPGVITASNDASDALAAAICHAHCAQTARHWHAAAARFGSSP